jgi:hypothetical protein
MEDTYFAKSFEDDLVLKTLKGKRKVAFQSMKEILDTGLIKPNTRSFGREMRLSTTILSGRYLKTYRPQGLIFKTKSRPNYILPFDLVLLSKAKRIIVQYYKIKNNLHLFYNHDLIDGFQKFVFKSFPAMVRTYPAPSLVWVAVQKFRRKNGYPSLTKQKHRLVEYNEAVFTKPIRITPVAIFGYRKNAKRLARMYGLPHFRTAKLFYQRCRE